jgi:hypothetical protein
MCKFNKEKDEGLQESKIRLHVGNLSKPNSIIHKEKEIRCPLGIVSRQKDLMTMY